MIALCRFIGTGTVIRGSALKSEDLNSIPSSS